MMLYFVVPSHDEARPIIRFFGLKKDMAPCPFPVFTMGEVALCVSGKGSANAAASTAYLLTRWGQNGLFSHLSSAEGPEDVEYPYAITDGTETVYQEMLYKPPYLMQEGLLIDPPALHAFIAAARFLPLKQIIVLRTIDERTLSWLDTLYFGMMAYPIYMWKKGSNLTP